MPDLSQRVRQPELLDGGGLPEDEVRRALLDLRRINRRFGFSRILVDALEQEVRRRRLTQFSLLDVASGSCDLPLAVINWAKRRGIKAQAFALEYQHRHLRLFRQEFASYPHLHPFCADAFRAPVPSRAFDFVTCGHFLHHLSEQEAGQLLCSMSAWARYAVIVEDLERHWLPYHFFRTFRRLFTTSYISRTDGLISLAQSFRKEEIEQIVQRTGLVGCRVERRWPFRLLLVCQCKKDSAAS